MKISKKKVHEIYGHGTLACSIIAHSRGRLHGTRRRVVWWELPEDQGVKRFVAENGGSRVIDWTMELQAKYIGDAWKKCLEENQVDKQQANG